MIFLCKAMPEKDFYSILGRWFSAAAFIFYFLVLSYFTLHTEAMVPDESSFFEAAKLGLDVYGSTNIWEIVKHPNSNGYGAIYWIAYAINIWLFGEYAFFIARFFTLLIFLSIPALYYYLAIRINPTLKNVVVLFWISFPVALWQGKITGPEMSAAAIGLVGLFLILDKIYSMVQTNSMRFLWGFLLLGMSIGIKPNSISILFYSAIIYLLKSENLKVTSSLFLVILLPALGVVVSNPILLFEPSIYFRNLIDQSSSGFNMQTWTPLYSERWLWDGVLSVGLFNWSTSLVVLLIITLYLFDRKYDHKATFAFFISFFASFFLVSKAQNYFSWHWIPFIILIPIQLLIFNKISYKLKKMLVVLVFINFTNNIEVIFSELKNKQKLIDNIKSSKETYSCIYWNIDWENALEVVDFSEVPIHNFLFFYFGFDETVINGKTSQLRGIASYRRINEILSSGYNFTMSKKTYLLVGKRISSRFWDLEKEAEFKNKFSLVKRCGDVDLFFLK